MMKVHPDRFAGRPAAERRVAEQWSTRINESYQLLKSPVKRAAWLCRLRVILWKLRPIRRCPCEFLLTQIAWREALESAQGNSEAIDAVRAEAMALREEVLKEITQAIDGDAAWERAVDLTRKLMFIDRFLEEAANE